MGAGVSQSPGLEDRGLATAWPERLLDAARRLGDDRTDEAAAATFWSVLNLALSAALRREARRCGLRPGDELRETAATKALEIFEQSRARDWPVLSMSPAQCVAFIRTVARNAAVDRLRRERSNPARDAATVDLESVTQTPMSSGSADGQSAAIAAEYAGALRACLGALEGRHRAIWFLRALCELPTRVVAEHAAVRLAPAVVDVYLGRARARLRACLSRKGYLPRDLPPGTFVRVWSMLDTEWSAKGVAE